MSLSAFGNPRYIRSFVLTVYPLLKELVSIVSIQ